MRRTSGNVGSSVAVVSEVPRDCGEIREKSARASPITSALLCGGRCAKLGACDEDASTGSDDDDDDDDEEDEEAASSIGIDSSTKRVMERLNGGLYAA